MSRWQLWFRAVAIAARDNTDLLLLAGVLVVMPPLVPSAHWLARADLTPWITLAVSAAALLRARRLGDGPHPALTMRTSASGSLLRRAMVALVPWCVLAGWDATRLSDPRLLWVFLALCATCLVLSFVSRAHGETAWAPRPGGSRRATVLIALALVSVVLGSGELAGRYGSLFGSTLLFAPAFGVQFLAAGLLDGRMRHLRQRQVAGLRSGGTVQRVTFRMLIAIFGPTISWYAITTMLETVLLVRVDFSIAYVVGPFVVAWAAVLWQHGTPVAVGVLLHEVIPEGGNDETPSGAAVAFERPPEGALRFNPRRVRRTRAVFPWVVPVRAARIENLDDPVVPLWPPGRPYPSSHVLGDASFEPDPATGSTQWDVITLRLGSRSDVMSLREEDAQARRVVVLRAFPRLGAWAHMSQPLTYRWQERVPGECLQVVDATLDLVQLCDGDILVLSAEGVARAYEVELGQPIRDPSVLFVRPPQLHDYVGLA